MTYGLPWASEIRLDLHDANIIGAFTLLTNQVVGPTCPLTPTTTMSFLALRASTCRRMPVSYCPAYLLIIRLA